MSQTWTVEGALTEVIQAIHDGTPLDIEPAVEDSLKARYRPSFQFQYDEGKDWNKDRTRVLTLARLIGFYATYFVMLESLQVRGPLPASIDEQNAHAAAHLIATFKVCPDVDLLGGWCPRNQAPSEHWLVEQFNMLTIAPPHVVLKEFGLL